MGWICYFILFFKHLVAGSRSPPPPPVRGGEAGGGGGSGFVSFSFSAYIGMSWSRIHGRLILGVPLR